MCDVAAMNDVVYVLLSQGLVHLLKAGAVVFVILQILDVSISNVCDLNRCAFQVISRLETNVVKGNASEPADIHREAIYQSVKTKLDHSISCSQVSHGVASWRSDSKALVSSSELKVCSCCPGCKKFVCTIATVA